MGDRKHGSTTSYHEIGPRLQYCDAAGRCGTITTVVTCNHIEATSVVVAMNAPLRSTPALDGLVVDHFNGFHTTAQADCRTCTLGTTIAEIIAAGPYAAKYADQVAAENARRAALQTRAARPATPQVTDGYRYYLPSFVTAQYRRQG